MIAASTAIKWRIIMKLVSFAASGRNSYGAVVGDGVPDRAVVEAGVAEDVAQGVGFSDVPARLPDAEGQFALVVETPRDLGAHVRLHLLKRRLDPGHPVQALDRRGQELPRDGRLWAVDRHRRRDPGPDAAPSDDAAQRQRGPAHRDRRSDLRHPDPDLVLLLLDAASGMLHA